MRIKITLLFIWSVIYVSYVSDNWLSNYMGVKKSRIQYSLGKMQLTIHTNKANDQKRKDAVLNVNWFDVSEKKIWPLIFLEYCKTGIFGAHICFANGQTKCLWICMIYDWAKTSEDKNLLLYWNSRNIHAHEKCQF